MIIYIHGTKTCGLDSNAALFKEYFEDEVLTPTFSYVPSLAVDTLEQLIEMFLNKGEKVGLVGTSMGGYYCMYLANKYDIKAVLINPAIIPY
ncbi:MAG: esterase, partial [Arcobacter sp.]